MQGRKERVIDWRELSSLLLATELLDTSPTWSTENRTKMTAWLSDYYRWLTTSAIGVAEKKAPINHGTWWDVQAMGLALYLGKVDDTRKIAEEFKTYRIGKQLLPDGKMPLPLERVDSWGYTVMNLTAMTRDADYASRVGGSLNLQKPGRPLNSGGFSICDTVCGRSYEVATRE